MKMRYYLIFLYIYNILSSMSYRDFYENIQDTVISKYKKKEYKVIDLREKFLFININLFRLNPLWSEKLINEEESSDFDEMKIEIKLDPSLKNTYVIYGNNKCTLKEFLTRKLKNRVINYEIIYNISAVAVSSYHKKVIDLLVKEIKEYHNNHRIQILRDMDLLILFFKDNLRSSEIIARDDKIIINFMFKKNNRLYCFNINFEEFEFKKYFIEILRDYEFSKLSDENILRRIFKDFKFGLYSYFYNDTEIHNDFIKNTSKEESKYEITPYIYDKNFPYVFYESHIIINEKKYSVLSFDDRNISKEMYDEMKEFFNFSLNLKNDDLLSVGLLYYSLTDDMKLLIINKLMESYYSPYSIIFFHILRSRNLLTANEFEKIMNLNFSLRSLNDNQKEKFALKIVYNNLFDEFIKKRLHIVRPIPKSCHDNYLMILFAKVLNEIYLSNDYPTERYHWKVLYDDILYQLYLPKDNNSAFNIFKHVLLDLENVIYILQYEQTAILEILAHISKNPPLIYHKHNFYFNLPEYKEMLQKENLDRLPIKDELRYIMN